MPCPLWVQIICTRPKQFAWSKIILDLSIEGQGIRKLKHTLVRYSSNNIRKAKNQHLNIVCQNLIGRYHEFRSNIFKPLLINLILNKQALETIKPGWNII